MKWSLLVDETTRAFIRQYPQHIAVHIFYTAWHTFMFHPDDGARKVLDAALQQLMIASHGKIMLVETEEMGSVDDSDTDETSYEHVTFH